jgi:hypothetical protein
MKLSTKMVEVQNYFLPFGLMVITDPGQPGM